MIEGIYQFNFHRDGDWLKKSVSYIRTEDACGFVVLNQDGKQCGAAIFDNFLHSCAQVTLVIQSPKAIKLGLLECAAQFIFDTCQKQFVYCMVSQANIRSLRLCKRIGFIEKTRIEKGASPYSDMIVLELQKHQLNLQSRKLLNRRAKHATL